MSDRKFFLDIQEEVRWLKEEGYEPLKISPNLWVYHQLSLLRGEANPQILILQKKEKIADKLKITTVIIEENSLGVLDVWERFIPEESSAGLSYNK